MNSFLIYLLKSTLCISLLYLVFRVVMRKESFFALNRIVLLSIIFTSVLIPLFHLPQAIQSPVQMELLPFLTSDKTQKVAGSNISIVQPIEHSLSVKSVPAKETNKTVFSTLQLLQYLYLAGLLITLLVLVHGLFSVLMLFRKAKSIKTEGYRLLVIEKEIAAFSFGRTVIISQKDYSEHRQPILTHEQAHIQLNHFFDLLLLEIVRIFHWFNPFVYWLIRDMKEIHEFQADDFTLNKGIDATQYQLLIIQKGVGPQRFALANSFNYCQIKKRIVMMNDQKQNRAWSWKVGIFVPLIVLLLMAFSKTDGVSQTKNITIQVKAANNQINTNETNPTNANITGVTDDLLNEYEQIVNRAKNEKGVPIQGKLSKEDQKRLETIYLSMNRSQQRKQMVFFLPSPPPLPRIVPTNAQLDSWQDSKKYGIWIDEKRVNNSVLVNSKANDFAQVFVSKLGKNTVNYGKHYYQVNLMTTEYYDNYYKLSMNNKNEYLMWIRNKPV